jgi:hypothetical protein
MLNSFLIRIAFYEGSDGPRLMLFGPLEAAFELLQKCFDELAECSETCSIDLDRLPWVYAAGGIKVRLTSCSYEPGTMKSIVSKGIQKTRIIPPAFEWDQTNEGWKHLSHLTQGLLDSKTPCHQYLTASPNEDAIVILSKGEYTDEVLES